MALRDADAFEFGNWRGHDALQPFLLSNAQGTI
jgi:hypothetical protein